MAGIQCNNSSFRSLELVQPGLSSGCVLPCPSLCTDVPLHLGFWGSLPHLSAGGPGLRSHLLSAVVQSGHKGSSKDQGCLPWCSLPPPDTHPSAAVRGDTSPLVSSGPPPAPGLLSCSP